MPNGDGGPPRNACKGWTHESRAQCLEDVAVFLQFLGSKCQLNVQHVASQMHACMEVCLARM